MGMKLKSGADLCGFQLTNFCVQGEASAPSDAALGRKYFHTNATDDVATGISLLNRERIYLGEGAWRATAYLDDIAAINEKLNLITGDTDTDTLINNLKDLEEFLKDFSETDKLKSLLDGKLSTSGGTIEGSGAELLKLDSSNANYNAIVFKSSGVAKSEVGFVIGGGAYLFDYTSSKYLGIDVNGTPFFGAISGTEKNTLIHSGNIGSYAVKIDTSKGESTASADAGNIVGYGNNAYDTWKLSGPVLSFGNLGYYGQFQKRYNSEELYFRSNTNGTKSDWKTVAFTDSTVAAAQKLVTSAGNAYVSFVDSENESYTYAKINGVGIGFNGNTIEAIGTNGPLYIQRNVTKNTIINQYGGNVLIGTSTDKGGKLQIDGYLRFVDQGVHIAASGTGKDWENTAIISTGWASGIGDYTEIGVPSSSANTASLRLVRNGDVYISGNLIVHGEVSAGGAGAEGGTSGSGSAEGVSEIFTPTSTSMAFDHNLGEDVIVQVYEKSGNVWNMVIVDTEITSATRVTLRFGKTETTQHKVVIMGV